MCQYFVPWPTLFFLNNKRRKMPDTVDDQISAKGV